MTVLYRHCSNCGKDFICNNPGEWLYVLLIEDRKKFYCCYECWMHAKELHPKKNYRRIRK
jgi:hypothetical protein